MLESNANNFIDSISSGVDVRTGMYSVNIPLMQFLSHRTLGLSIPITLSYSAGSTVDIGFGRGWSVSLSHYDKTSGSISLSTGQSFKIYKPWGSDEYKIPYRKLKDVKIFHLSESDELKVVNKEGECEYLSSLSGHLKKITSPQGHSVYFDYNIWTGRLDKIYDNEGREIKFDWSNVDTKVIVNHEIDYVIVQSVIINKSGNGIYRRLSKIKLDKGLPNIELDYRYIASSNYDVIEKVTHPTGLVEKMVYLDKGHSLPDGAPMLKIPFIQSHRIIPTLGDEQDDQPVTLTEYEYSDKNYLGFASERKWIAGEDTLFKSSANYTYNTTEIVNKSKVTVRKYNKYHLLDSEEHYDNDVLYKEEEYKYGANLNNSIEKQPATYSLPIKQTTTHYKNGESRSATKKYKYDDYANLTFVQEADGSKELYTYYPAEGEVGKCPVDPNGMISRLKEYKFSPVITQYKEKPRVHKFEYKSIARIDKPNEYFIVPKSVSGDNLTETTSYYENSEQPTFYGYLKETVSKINGYENKTTAEYEFLTTGLKTTATLLTHDQLTKISSVTTECHRGLPIEQTDDGEPTVRVTYDSLGRKSTSTVAPDTDNSAKATFKYAVGAGSNKVTQTDAKGNMEIREYNNAGKTIAVKRSIDGKDYLVQSMRYNEFGQLESSKEYDWVKGVKGVKEISITTKFEYDSNGQVKKITHGDGRTETIEQNPVTLTTVYEQTGLLTETSIYNLAGLVVEKNTTDADASPLLLAKTENEYDGFGNLRSTKDTQGRVTKYRYDMVDRLEEIEREIDGKPIIESYSYHDFTNEELVKSATVNNVVLGKRDFDGLGRLKEETVNGGIHSYEYTAAYNQPKSVTLPDGSIIDLKNNINLQTTESISVRGTPELACHYSFDPQSALPTYSINQGCKRSVTRNSLGRVEVDEIELNDGEVRISKEEYSIQGRLLKSEDYFDNYKKYGYDSLGRPETITEYVSGTTATTHIEYDSYSRPWKYSTERGQDEAVIEIEYNSIGMETQRIAKFNDVEEFTIDQTYNSNLQIQTRTYSDALGETTETFSYDNLSRLETYTCSGPNIPSDEYGHQIVKQVFSHDLYGNIKQLDSHFSQGTMNTAVYTYNPINPVQLENITNTHPSYPSNIHIKYDKAGNMLNDERGNTYIYNQLGQLTSVENNVDEELSIYQYDGDGRMVSQTVEEQLVYLFYSKGDLVNETSGGVHSSYLHVAPGFVGRSVKGEANYVQHEFLFGNSQGSVIESLSTVEDTTERDKKTRNYTPYGEG
ncbi:hypothetical protein A1QK_16505 [Vibrio genomosp. F10 str. 9ZD137]|nr:hypothetical protein A1QK_16505 [Vibrio genomosp. F10 str. 9ZD137]